MKQRVGSLKKINDIDKPLIKPIKRKRRHILLKSQMRNVTLPQILPKFRGSLGLSLKTYISIH
jgi:hypothetical protein